MGDIIVRGLSSATIEKLDQLYRKKHFPSREAYLRAYINNLAVLDELKELDLKYQQLLSVTHNVIQENTLFFSRLQKYLEQQECATSSTFYQE